MAVLSKTHNAWYFYNPKTGENKWPYEMTPNEMPPSPEPQTSGTSTSSDSERPGSPNQMFNQLKECVNDLEKAERKKDAREQLKILVQIASVLRRLLKNADDDKYPGKNYPPTMYMWMNWIAHSLDCDPQPHNQAVNWSNERIANCLLMALISLWELYASRGWCSSSGCPKRRRH